MTTGCTLDYLGVKYEVLPPRSETEGRRSGGSGAKSGGARSHGARLQLVCCANSTQQPLYFRATVLSNSGRGLEIREMRGTSIRRIGYSAKGVNVSPVVGLRLGVR